ncbi:hypothetical protein JW813_06820 [Clostridium botulinum]|uniref:hypothetical protein n=1 Tax=Clostridium botulinum TaxID=1491 RepID=UPI002245836D|nr:hypothetical protein [Clostridium botulinum]UZP04717.1 hypothetical protein JW813_06820 [Clostridium botulinum]UZP08129.1 hypothetical protein JYA71_07095 [Clostridium botulinum]UZP11456.1 hypothetical protein JYA74_06815 [Clostridium botulinum]
MKEKVSLNEVIRDAYIKKNARELFKDEMQDKPYKNYSDECTKKLRDICKVLNSDLEEFKNDKGTFDLPIVVAEIFKAYLLEKSGKGSFISKLRNGKLSDITFEEKRDFIGKIKINLKEKYKDDELNKDIDIEVEEISRALLHEAKYSEKVKDIIATTQFFSNLLIEASIVKLSGINELEGFVSVNNPNKSYSDNSDVEEELKKVRETKVDISKKLTIEDKIELMEYLEVFLKEKIKEWVEIVNIAGEIREQDVEDYKFEKRDMIKSRELINLAISDYKEKLQEERLPALKSPHTEEEIKTIL